MEFAARIIPTATGAVAALTWFLDPDQPDGDDGHPWPVFYPGAPWKKSGIYLVSELKPGDAVVVLNAPEYRGPDRTHLLHVKQGRIVGVSEP